MSKQVIIVGARPGGLAAGLRLDDHMDLPRLDPQWRSFFQDGSVLDLHQEVNRMVETLEAFSPDTTSADGYQRFIQLSERLNRISNTDAVRTHRELLSGEPAARSYERRRNYEAAP